MLSLGLNLIKDYYTSVGGFFLLVKFATSLRLSHFLYFSTDQNKQAEVIVLNLCKKNNINNLIVVHISNHKVPSLWFKKVQRVGLCQNRFPHSHSTNIKTQKYHSQKKIPSLPCKIQFCDWESSLGKFVKFHVKNLSLNIVHESSEIIKSG